MTSFLFLARTALLWLVPLVILAGIWSEGIGAPDWIAVLFVLGTLLFAMSRAIAHLHRVRLLADRVDWSVLGNRHRRQVEIPLPAGPAFELVEAAVRELPNVEAVEASPGSLQLRAVVTRIDPYRGGAADKPGKRRRHPNQVLATVTPRGTTSSVTLVCEPGRGPWADWLRADAGTNLENAEAIVRAISRRISEGRSREEAQVRETATEKALAVAKLSLLHSQVEPHFLYNTLASAQLLTRSDPAKADRMIGNLITYLRHSLPRAEESVSSLGEELERARAYLEILQIRMGERLRLDIQVPDSLRGLPLPPMMLQTLVENAIKHGLEPVPGGGTVWILAREQGSRVAVTVADDGRGFSEDGGGTGIGLRNVRERLRLAYGDAAAFTIAANFPRGVAATITVPATGPKEAAHA